MANSGASATRSVYPVRPYRMTMRGEYSAWMNGIRPENDDNGPQLTRLLKLIRQSGHGGNIKFEPGADYKVKTAITDAFASSTTPDVELDLQGSRLVADGSLLSSGTLLTPGRNFHCFNGAFHATSQRTGGSFVTVVGEVPLFQISYMQIEFGAMSMTNGFDGVTLSDGAGAKGVCGFSWDGSQSWGYVRNFAPGGHVFNINTPSGVILAVRNVMHIEPEGTADGVRPAATMRLQGCADFRMTGIASAYSQRSLIMDPPSGGRVAAVFMNECEWGNTTQEGWRCVPDVAADFHSITSVGGYCDVGGLYFGAASKAVSVSRMVLLANSPNDAIQLDGCSGMAFEGMSFSGANAKCFHAKNNAKNFRMTGVFRNAGSGVNNVGVHIESGCDKYQVNMVGGEYCTTPKTAPVDDATKVCQVF